MVSWRFSCWASFSLVPTPSVPDTSTGSRYLPERSNSAPKPPSAAHHLRAEAALDQRLDALDEFVARVDVDAGIAVGERGGAGLGGSGRGAGHGGLWRSRESGDFSSAGARRRSRPWTARSPHGRPASLRHHRRTFPDPGPGNGRRKPPRDPSPFTGTFTWLPRGLSAAAGACAGMAAAPRGPARGRRPRRCARRVLRPRCRSTARARPSATPPSPAAWRRCWASCRATVARRRSRACGRNCAAHRNTSTATTTARTRASRPPARPRFRTTLVVRFDGGRSMTWSAALGLPVWPQPRPKPVLWLAIDDGRGPRLVGAGAGQCRAPGAGPARDRARLPARPAERAAPPNRPPSARSGAATPPPSRAPRATTARRCSWSASSTAASGGWKADWIFVDSGRVLSKWSETGADARRAMAAGADGAADALIRRYAKRAARGPARRLPRRLHRHRQQRRLHAPVGVPAGHVGGARDHPGAGDAEGAGVRAGPAHRPAGLPRLVRATASWSPKARCARPRAAATGASAPARYRLR